MTVTPTLHPVIRPPEQHEIPQAPVRDDDATGPTEDLDRQPDGMPHNVMGLTYLFSILLALLVAFMFLTGKTAGGVCALVLLVLAVPVVVSTLRNKAARDRDQVHPSR